MSKKRILINSIVIFFLISQIALAIKLEEILEKVEKQKEILNDMEAIITMNKLVGNRIFTEKAKYYYKKPAMIRMEYSPSGLIVITKGDEVMIKEISSSGSRVIKKPIETEIISVDGEKLKFIDKYYITIDEVESKGNIYKLNCYSKILESKYLKIELYIDYDKGVIIKIKGYDRNNKIMYERENKDYHLMSNCWFPYKVITKYYQPNIITVENIFEEIEINKGIDDSMFKF